MRQQQRRSNPTVLYLVEYAWTVWRAAYSISCCRVALSLEAQPAQATEQLLEDFIQSSNFGEAGVFLIGCCKSLNPCLKRLAT